MGDFSRWVLKRAVVSLAATGDVVVAVPDKVIKVVQYAVQSENDAMRCQFRDGAAGSFLGLNWKFNDREGAQSGPVKLPYYIFKTSPGEPLRAVLSGAGTVNIEVAYTDSDKE